MGKELTNVQAKILKYLQQFANSGEPMPTLREICKAFGWASTATARDHLRALAVKGKVTLPGRRSRQIRVIRARSGVTHLPFIGSVVAGIPIEAEENIEQVIPVPSEWTTTGTHFVLRVVGDSMVGAGILNGDYVVVRSQQKAEVGDIVIVTINGETTLKRLRRSGDVLTLIAESKKYRPIPVRSESSSVQGVVVGLLRSYADKSVS
jgi:repressor LexA